MAPLSIGCQHFSPGNPENDSGRCVRFPIKFGRRIQLNDIRVEAVEESEARQDNFLEAEEPPQLPLPCSAWHPIKQIVQ
jgi:hypothetical protein